VLPECAPDDRQGDSLPTVNAGIVEAKIFDRFFQLRTHQERTQDHLCSQQPSPEPFRDRGAKTIRSKKEKNMPTKQNQNYQEILKQMRERLKFLKLDGEELSLGSAINLLFLLRGEWVTLGEYSATLHAVGELVGKQLLWEQPIKAVTAVGASSTLVA
jgi:hypothetical protein